MSLRPSWSWADESFPNKRSWVRSQLYLNFSGFYGCLDEFCSSALIRSWISPLSCSESLTNCHSDATRTLWVQRAHLSLTPRIPGHTSRIFRLSNVEGIINNLFYDLEGSTFVNQLLRVIA
ncbi:hypothetical protein BJX64DRAFT_205915 [Aspergillus heterothallicus]